MVFGDLEHPLPLILSSPGPGQQMHCHRWQDECVTAHVFVGKSDKARPHTSQAIASWQSLGRAVHERVSCKHVDDRASFEPGHSFVQHKHYLSLLSDFEVLLSLSLPFFWFLVISDGNWV